MYRSVIGTRASRCQPVPGYKTLAQQLAVGFALCPLTALDAKWLWNLCLWSAVFLALYSAVQYFWRMPRRRCGPCFLLTVSVV